LRLLALLSLFVFSSFVSTVIESDSASYDGKKMHLSGAVSLKHTLGTISAENASVTKEDDKKDFSLIEVQDNVLFTPSFGGELSADFLLLKAEDQIADLKALKPTSWVTYRGEFSKQPLTFKSRNIQFIFSSDTKTKAAAFNGVNEIKAKGPVKTTFAKHFKLFSDEAAYKSSDSKLTFFCLDQSDTCTLVYDDKSQVKAKTVVIDPHKHLIIACNPDGVFKAKNYDDIFFNSKTLSFDENGKLLTLSNDVNIHSMGFSCLNDHEVIFTLDPDQDSAIKNLKCQGKTLLSDSNHTTLTCHGSLVIDRELNKIILEGKNEPILFESTLGKIRSDKAIIEYVMEGSKAVPSKLYFQGKVACINFSGLFKNEKEEIKRYALADNVTYIPAKKELTLKSQKPSKVLFYDENKKTKFSAEQIVIDLPDNEKKERIKTSGNVRMIFSDKEDAEFKKVFAFEE
jgi:hypothetical protein